MNKEEQSLYEEQVSLVVRAFTQVWNKFESTLSRELLNIREQLEGMQTGSEHHPGNNANHELFYRVGSIIILKESMTMGELSTALSVPLSSATRIADWLVDNGYLHRLPDPEDRRVVRIALTPNGRELYQSIDKYIRQRIQQILSPLTEEERITLVTLMGKVVSALKEASR